MLSLAFWASRAPLDPIILFAVWATDNPIDPIAWLVNYGVAGLVLALFVTGQIRSKHELRGLEKQIEAKDQVISAFQAQITGNTLPALARSAQVLEALPASTDRELQAELRRAYAEIAELSHSLRDRSEDSASG